MELIYVDTVTKMILSESQQIGMDLFKSGKNIFISGPAGTGKSHLISEIYKECRGDIQVCATTGCASSLLQSVGAKTIHSWSGIGTGVGSSRDVISRINTNKKIVKQWKKINILVIDEISMLSAKTFGLLDDVARSLRNNTLPFGGIQLILTGDFYQLPPVGNQRDPLSSAFCFESDRWGSTIDNVVELTTCFRHVDPLYATIMKEVRIGVISKKNNEILKSRVTKYDKDDIHCIIYPNRYKVDRINSKRLNELDPDTQHVYTPICSDSRYDVHRHEPIELRVGAEVMCTANIETFGVNYLVNGTQGKVVSFRDELPVVSFRNGITRVIGHHEFPTEIDDVQVIHIPLMLAWAITIHKSQGITLESAEIDAGSGIFECGQTYVALSRLKTLDGLYLSGYDVSKIKVNKKVKRFYKEISNQ
jgi:ATP-dependent DNA helicase PIF1